VIPPSIRQRLELLPPHPAEGHDLRLERRPDLRTGSLFLGCPCRPGVWLSVARDGVKDTWTTYRHDWTFRPAAAEKESAS